MKQNKVREVQHYLTKRGIQASEVAIVNAAIDIVHRLGAGDHLFVGAFKGRVDEYISAHTLGEDDTAETMIMKYIIRKLLRKKYTKEAIIETFTRLVEIGV